MNTHTESSTLVKERSGALLGMYQENRAHARHHESQRVTVSSIIVASSVGLVSLVSAGGLTRADWPLTAALISIGLCGTMFTATQFERIRLYKRRANEYRRACDDLLFKGVGGAAQTPDTLEGIIVNADREHRKRFPLLCSVSGVKWFWIFWPLTIAIIGTLATAYVLYAL